MASSANGELVYQPRANRGPQGALLAPWGGMPWVQIEPQPKGRRPGLFFPEIQAQNRVPDVPHLGHGSSTIRKITIFQPNSLVKSKSSHLITYQADTHAHELRQPAIIEIELKKAPVQRPGLSLFRHRFSRNSFRKTILPVTHLK